MRLKQFKSTLNHFWNTLTQKRPNKKDEFRDVIEEQIKENRSTLEALKEYDEGKRDIDTSDLEKRYPNVPNTP